MSLREYHRKRNFAENVRAAREARSATHRQLPSSCKSTMPRICITTCAWNSTACSKAGPSPRAPTSIRRTSGWRCRSKIIRSNTAASRGRFPQGKYGGGTVMLWDAEAGSRSATRRAARRTPEISSAWRKAPRRMDARPPRRPQGPSPTERHWFLFKSAISLPERAQPIGDEQTVERRDRARLRARSPQQPDARLGTRRGCAERQDSRRGGKSRHARWPNPAAQRIPRKLRRQTAEHAAPPTHAGFELADAGTTSACPPADELAARDQVRRLSDAVPGRRRQGTLHQPQRPRLDGQVSRARRAAGGLPVKTAMLDGEVVLSSPTAHQFQSLQNVFRTRAHRRSRLLRLRYFASQRA